MEHQPSNVKIYYTKDYGLFNIISGNRQLNESKINRIRDDIDDGLDVLKLCPIIVAERDGRLDIIDGQHRFYVAKQLGSPVWYIVSEGLTLQEIAKVNSNTEKWKSKDFINCYAVQGNRHYIQLEEFIRKYRFPVSVALRLLADGTLSSTGGFKGSFQDGTFKAVHMQEAEAIAERVMLFSEFPRHKSGPFVGAICRIVAGGKIDVEELAEKYRKNPEELKPQASSKAYLFNLESIFNKGLQSRRIIY